MLPYPGGAAVRKPALTVFRGPLCFRELKQKQTKQTKANRSKQKQTKITKSELVRTNLFFVSFVPFCSPSRPVDAAAVPRTVPPAAWLGYGPEGPGTSAGPPPRGLSTKTRPPKRMGTWRSLVPHQESTYKWRSVFSQSVCSANDVLSGNRCQTRRRALEMNSSSFGWSD
jgi:hypothetical protein